MQKYTKQNSGLIIFYCLSVRYSLILTFLNLGLY